ncbi:RNA polymerase sigma-70 factor, ECF subfamily [Mariniphaga anaerophila]|uniref:RNA polymerase sigma factor n=1 Tax=Mariniphaga anaerophila TaxID=1484053 RepID=A0A1M5G1B8_9BACT|nr:RNA polymerase sigma-70 factor, ECF subfamily [Mariniphaga anaerophila]
MLILLKKGDMLAFDTIYKQYSKRLYAFVFRYLKQDNDTEEIVQEVFLKIWESRKKIDLYTSFDSFLFTIAYNSTISLLRKRVNEKKYLDHIKSRQQVNNAENIIDDIHFKEMSRQVEVLLDELTPRQKEVFVLSREDGLTHDEIAEKLGISSNTVKNHLVATLAFLKSKLKGDLMIKLLFISLFF